MKRHLVRAFERLDAMDHRLQGLIAGIASLGVALLLCLAMLWALGYERPTVNSSDANDLLLAKLAFAQTYASFAAILLASGFGYFAVKEFAQSQQSPELRLGIYPDWSNHLTTQAMGLDCPEDFLPHPVFIAIMNDGPRVGLWYSVEMRIGLLPSPKAFPETVFWDSEMKTPRGWDDYRAVEATIGRIGVNWLAQWNKQQGEWVLTFRSNGAFAAYPGIPLHFAALSLDRRFVQYGRHSIAWTIWAERSRPRQGNLIIDVQPERQVAREHAAIAVARPQRKRRKSS